MKSGEAAIREVQSTYTLQKKKEVVVFCSVVANTARLSHNKKQKTKNKKQKQKQALLVFIGYD